MQKLSKAKKIIIPLLAAALLIILLSFAGDARLSSGRVVKTYARHISAVIEPEDLELLGDFKNLRTVDFSGSSCYEEICLWAQEHPEIYVHYTVALPGGHVADSHAGSLDIVIEDEEQLSELSSLIAYLPRLEAASLDCSSPELGYSSLKTLSRLRPDVDFLASFRLCGRAVSSADSRIDMSGASESDIYSFKTILPALYCLESVDLGSDESSPAVDFADIRSMQELRPDVSFDFDFELYGREVSLSDESLNLSHAGIPDEGELVRQVISCMPELSFLDMDTAGVSNEAMASIRDDFPDVKVVWRVWFGDNYTVRTDVETILASRPSIGGNLLSSNAGALKYCTEVRYLDIGHNDMLDDISFIAYMPKLEVAILAMGCWSDTSAIACCPELEYLEIQTTNLTDLRPLSGLTKLRHLNICYLFELTDITPLYGLTQLERLWIGCLDPVPQEQIDEMQRRAPQCVINTTTYDPTEGGWRYRPDLEGGLDPRYALLREQFGYAKGNGAFAFPWNDPYFSY